MEMRQNEIHGSTIDGGIVGTHGSERAAMDGRGIYAPSSMTPCYYPRSHPPS
jgi:hypothetical protein